MDKIELIELELSELNRLAHLCDRTKRCADATKSQTSDEISNTLECDLNLLHENLSKILDGFADEINETGMITPVDSELSKIPFDLILGRKDENDYE